MKKATLEAFADELTDEDLSTLLGIDDSISPANVSDVIESSGPGVSLLLEDED